MPSERRRVRFEIGPRGSANFCRVGVGSPDERGPKDPFPEFEERSSGSAGLGGQRVQEFKAGEGALQLV
jgi:hypothetical protein